tara:strand:+ start:1158 stop:1994 length:837 start_codon:yes stop_codon:yes gene_type:complete
MQTVRLMGDLGERFGEVWEVNVTSVAEIFKLIGCNTVGLQQYLVDCAESGVDFTVQQGEDFYGNDEFTLNNALGSEDIIIAPVPAGDKKALTKILAAILIVVVMYLSFGSWGAMANALAGKGVSGFVQFATWTGLSMAVNLAIAGITQMLAPGPEVDNPERNEAYLFNGPVNQAKEGIGIPIAYGELMVGGTAINVSLRSTPFPGGAYNFGAYNYGQEYNGNSTNTSGTQTTHTSTNDDTTGNTWQDPAGSALVYEGYEDYWGNSAGMGDDYININYA